MTKKTQWLPYCAKLPLAVAVAASVSTPVSAFQFYLGDLEASLDTTLSAGASWRMEDPNPVLVGLGNGGEGASINSDDGNLNFEKGETYSKLIKGSSDFLLQGDGYGAFVRAKYWYDFELKDEGMATDELGQTRQLSPAGDRNASGAEFLDAFVWADYWLGDMPLNLRLGKQVVSWGESTFIFNGINVINPVDVGAIRAPGAEIKDALLPVNMAYGSLGLTDNITVEGFVQLEYEKSRIGDCGTFFSTTDYVADECGPVYALNQLSEDLNKAGLGGIQPYLPREADREPDDTDQFGVALRWYAPELNETEFGFYFVQYHSRFPTVGGITAVDTDGSGDISNAEAFDPVTGAKYFVEYPERIKMLGVSFNTTTPNGISVSGEYSYKMDMPLQANSPDLVVAALGRSPDAAPGNVYSPIFQNRVSDQNGDGIVNVTDADLQGFLGAEQSGYDVYDVSQLQFTGISFVDQVFGASRLALVGEIGATYVHDLPELSEMRYGRFDQVGFGITEDYFPADGVSAAEACDAANVIDQCNSEGYTTAFSWGYRARASLTYNNVFAGVNLTPTLAWSHDVKGYAPGPGANFVEGRKSAGLSVKADYLNQYSVNLAYTSYFGNERFNELEDRDNLSLSASYSF